MPDPAPSFIAQERTAFRSHIVSEGGAWFFSISLVLFIAAAVLAGGLFFYQRTLQAGQAQWQEQVAAQEGELRPELFGQLIDLSNSMAVSRQLLDNHVFSSNVLLFIQSVIHPFVYFNSFSFSRDSRRIEVSGAANLYRTVSDQVSIIESHPQVEKVDFGGLSRDEKGRVNFKLAIIFKSSLLQFRTQ